MSKHVYLPSYADFTAPGDWAADGACCGSDSPNMSDQIPSGRGFMPNTRAKRVCEGCDVQFECRSWALAHQSDPTPGLIVGGLFTHERRRLRAEQMP